MKTGAKFSYRDGFEVDFVLAEGGGPHDRRGQKKGTDGKQLMLLDRKFRGRSSGNCSSRQSEER
jgi:hypothetical protein